jgi:hypothetical protein
MSSLAELMNEELPLNRKERFFTGTVFPMIVCRDDFKHFGYFLEMIGCDECPEISANPGETNIQFFTEYNLFESIFDKKTRGRFTKKPEARDTPDVIVLIKTDVDKVLIAIEAKMYDVPAEQSLKAQMDRQQKILNFLERKLKIARIYHYALLPDELFRGFENFDYPTITWEQLYNRYNQIYGKDYFLELLRIALDLYPDLKSLPRSFETRTGKQIYKAFKEDSLSEITMMGRDEGLYGSNLKQDITTGQWKTRNYAISEEDGLPTPATNWFPIETFVLLIDVFG